VILAVLLAPVLAIASAQIAPPEMSPAGPQGLAFVDGEADPVILDGFGRAMWRIARDDAHLLVTYPLRNATDVNMRTLVYDAGAKRFLSTEGDQLVSIDGAGAVTPIATFERANMFATSLAGGTLWAIDDCLDRECTKGQGARLSTIDLRSGARTIVRDFGDALGQATAVAVLPDGRIAIATFGRDGYARVWLLADAHAKARALGSIGLARMAMLTAMAIDPSTGSVLAIAEHRGATPRTWTLVTVPGVTLRSSLGYAEARVNGHAPESCTPAPARAPLGRSCRSQRSDRRCAT
jgi:hypothetical protein